MIDPQTLIGCQGLVFSRPGEQVPPGGAGTKVLDGVDFRLGFGDRIGLVGPNGAGKSTLFRLLLGLAKPEAGRVLGIGRVMQSPKDFQELRKHVGLLFQDADDMLFCPTVLEEAAFGPMNIHRDAKKARRIALETLDRLGIVDLADRVPHRLSGGEKRLSALAAVLSMRPKALLLDEPTSGVDEAHVEKLIHIVNGLDAGLAVVSHDRDFLAALGTRNVQLKDGRIEAVV